LGCTPRCQGWYWASSFVRGRLKKARECPSAFAGSGGARPTAGKQDEYMHLLDLRMVVFLPGTKKESRASWFGWVCADETGHGNGVHLSPAHAAPVPSAPVRGA